MQREAERVQRMRGQRSCTEEGVSTDAEERRGRSRPYYIIRQTAFKVDFARKGETR